MLPARPALAYDPAFSFVVRASDSTNILSAQTGLTYTVKLPAPKITSLDVASGPAAGNNFVTVTGANFTSGSVVLIDGRAATTTFVSPTSLKAVMPAHAAGGVTLTVKNADGQTSGSAAYTYNAQLPTVTSVSPTTGPTSGGTTVTINGTNFTSGSTVAFDTVAATSVTYLSPTRLTAVSPAHGAGLSAVSVTVNGVTNGLKSVFEYTATMPSIGSFTPAVGTEAGGTSVTISGSNFVSGAKVSFGTVAASSVSFVNTTTLKVVAPAQARGAVALTVTNPDGQKVSSASMYSYRLAGDTNADNRVNAIDLSILLSHDGQNYPAADFNNDGTVGAADLAILLSKWTW